MALTKNINKEVFGKIVPFDSVYIRIEKIYGDKQNLNITVNVYDSEKKNIIETNDYWFTPDVNDTSENFIKQGYEYLKTLPKYADVTDC